MSVYRIVSRNTVRRTQAIDLRDFNNSGWICRHRCAVQKGGGEEIVIQQEYELDAISLYRDFFAFIVFREYEHLNLCACE